MRKLVTCGAVAMLVALGGIGHHARADAMPAVKISDKTGADHFENFTIGWAFSTVDEVIVTKLGVFDSGQDGLVRSHAVGIFNADGQLLASATVTTDDPLIAQFRYHDIEKLTLPKGKAFTIGALYPTTDDPIVFPEAKDFSIDARLSFTHSRNHAGNTLAAPDTDGPEGPGYFAPNLVLASGPSTLALLAAGALAWTVRRWRRPA